MNIKRRAITLMMVIIASISVIFGYFHIEHSHKGLIDDIEYKKDILRRFFIELESENRKKLTVFADDILLNSDVINSFATGDRENLYEILSPIYKNNLNNGIELISFINSDGSHFLRVHAKDRFGDNISQLRTIIDYSIKKREIVSAYDVTLYDISYLIMYPVYDGENFLGILQIGSKVTHLIDTIYSMLNIKSAIFFKQHLTNRLLAKHKTIVVDGYELVNSNDEFFNNLPKDFSIDTKEYEKNGQTFMFDSFNIKDYKGEIIAKILFATDISEYVEELNDDVIKIVATLLIALIIIYFVLNISFNRLLLYITQKSEELRESQERYKQLFENNQSISLLIDKNLNIIDANYSACRFYGYSKAELLKIGFDKLLKNRDDFENKRWLSEYEIEQILKNGEDRDVEIYSGLIEINQTMCDFLIIHDITDKNIAKKIALDKQMEIESLLKKERYIMRILRTVADVNEYLIVSKTVDELVKNSCDRIVEHGDYVFCWIGTINSGGDLEVLYQTHKDDYLPTNIISLKEGSTYYKTPAVQAIIHNEPILLEDLDEDFYTPLDKNIKDKFKSIISLPLRANNFEKPFGVLVIYSENDSGFSTQEIVMLRELAGDIGFAADSYKQKEQLFKLEEEKIKNYANLVDTFVDFIERRDTYTAGHTRRVANYCEMIALKMGYSQDDIRKLKLASNLHDIGKIVTPDSILLKPGTLNEVEYNLIKMHAFTGYEMLSRVDMYRDLAEIMRDHHEKYDGSGYPRGLKGDEIYELSRIMIVADAFDAMTTNRIYKGRKSIDIALEELKSLSGSWYHPEVVEVALEVLKDVKLDTTISQMPISEIENERFSYFFKDQLTSLFNDDYLYLMLQKEEVAKYLYTIKIKNFTNFNKSYGWVEGNRVLKEFGLYLKNMLEENLIFRIHGDDYLVLTSNELDLSNLDISHITKDSNIYLDINRIELSNKDFKHIEKLVQEL